MKLLKNFVCGALLCVLLLAFVGCKSENGDTEDKGVYVDYNGTRIVMGAAADDIIKSLGEPTEKREIGDCGGLGAQVKYSYDSLEVYVLESKTDGNIIDGIIFRDDLVETPEGVCIGQSVDKAKELLGEPTESDDKSLKYKKDAYVLLLGCESGTITSVDYITPAE